jgi:Protein of unknown function (DUF3093)
MDDYRERLHVPLIWWMLAVASLLTLAATLYGLPQAWIVVIIAASTVVCIAMLVNLGQARITVGAGMLRTGKTGLPLASASEVVALDEKQTRLLRGPRGHPAAHLYSRPYLKESVYIALDPAAGPTAPYWLIGTRRPAELAAIIERSRLQARHEPVA